MNTTSKIVLGWSAFAGTHLLMSHPGNREKIITAVGGDKNFLGIYSAVALATFLPQTHIYIKYRRATPAFNPGTLANALGLSLNSLALLCWAQTIATPSAAGLPEQEKMKSEEQTNQVTAKGINRISRHPLFMSLALLGVGQALRLRRAPDLAYWLGFPIFWVIGSVHQDYRLKMKLPQTYYDQTSILPFKAIIEGRNDAGKAFNEMSLQGFYASLALLAIIFARKPLLARFKK